MCMKKSLLITLLGVLSISLANAQTNPTLVSVASTNATISWSSATGDVALLDPAGSADAIAFFADFEQGIDEGWTTYDADGDGYNWETRDADVSSNDTNCLTSASYLNSTGAALTPDNWLFTPQIELGGTMTFTAWGQDADWAAEHFAVYVCTADEIDYENFSEDNFVEVLEETEATGDVTTYTVDLSEFAGQNGYVAFRHFNCTDMFFLNIDDVIITKAGASAWTIFENVASPYTITGLTPLTSYAVKVRATSNAAWSDPITFVTLDPYAAPWDVMADNITASTADIYWEANDNVTSFNVKYARGLIDSFENGLGNWTTLDADGDGKNWGLTEYPYNGSYAASSASYSGGALTPDNWLISPKVELGGSVSFWYSGYSSWPEEVFTVYVSTTGTDPSDFVAVTEDITATSEYQLLEVDLSNYSGEGYIAIRHHDCTDQYYLFIDDVTIMGPATIITSSEKQASLENLESLTQYVVQVQAVYDDQHVTAWTEPYIFTTVGDIVLYANDVNNQNMAVLTPQDGNEVPSVMIDGLILNNDGLYHPICLPFSLTADELADSPLAGITLKVPTSFVEEEGESKVYFEDATEIEANRVYFYKLTGAPIRSPKFENVTIESERAEYSNAITEDMYDISVYGLYTVSYSSSFPIYAYDDENQFFYQCSSYATQPFTGHLMFYNEAEEVTAVFETESDIPTGISEVTTKSNGTWFNAQGVKLNGKPAQKGIYVSNGKKFVVK